jgi:uncharacterized membrane protein YGL010W
LQAAILFGHNMNDYFRSQLTIYAGYHRDERNRVTHMFGIPMILLAIVLPLSLWPVTVFGIPANAAMLLAIPALSGWILLDVAIGLVILAAIIPLLLISAVIASHASSIGVWLIAAVLFVIGWALQIVGHVRFEHRKLALLDNPMHLLIGPMFMIAKLFVALGFRPDLARALQRD